MMVTIGARGRRSSGLSGFLASATYCPSASCGRLISNSQPASAAIISAMSGSTGELMVMVGGRPWPISLKSSSPERLPMASESERTVIGKSIGTFPLRGWVGPLTLTFFGLNRTRGPSSSSRPTAPRLTSVSP